MVGNNDRCSLTPTNPTSRFLPFSASLLLCVFALNNAPVLRITDFMHLSPLWGFVVFGACRVLYTCRPSGALGYLVHVACYKHAAPLGLNAAMHRNSRHCIHRGERFPRPAGWGTQPLRLHRFVMPSFLCVCVFALNIPHVLRIADCVSL